MNRDKLFFRHVLLHYFDLKKSAAETHRLLFEMVMKLYRKKTCRVWFERFRNCDFDVRDKNRPGQPKKFENVELQELLDENPAQTLLELSKVVENEGNYFKVYSSSL